MAKNLTIQRLTARSLMLTAMMMLTALTAQAAEYGIKINGQAVTDANKTDLVTAMPSAFTGGEAMYDSGTKTLVLNDAMMNDGGNIPVIEVTQDELTIEVTGECEIMAMSGGYGLQIDGDAHVTLTGRGTLRIEAATAVFLGDETISGSQNPKLTLNGPTLIANGSERFGIAGFQYGTYQGELEIIYGTIQAWGLNGSIVELGKITTGTNAYLKQPANAIIDEHEVRYEPWDGYILSALVVIEAPRPDNETPLTIEAKEEATVSYKNPNGFTFGYRINNAKDITWTSNVNVTLSAGSKMELYGKNKAYCKTAYESNATRINFTGDCYVYGNVMSLVQAEGFETLTKLESTSHYAFAYLFKGNSHLLSHPQKKIVLPALELSLFCYYYMFSDCSALERAPKLPATKLAGSCYRGMFSGCTNLKEAPNLPAATLEEYCYSGMFSSCTTITTAPLLQAETLVKYCYRSMFNGCSNLTSVTCLALDISADGCTTDWLKDVSPSGTFTYAKGGMFELNDPSGIPMGWSHVLDNTKQPCGLSFTADHVEITYMGMYEMPELVNPNELPVTYSSSDPTVATVDGSGNVNVLKAGTTTITATFYGSDAFYSGYASYTLTVTSAGMVPDFAFDREAVVLSYGETAPAVVLTMSDGLNPTYTSDNESVAKVDAATGAVSIRGKGVATITATTDADLLYKGATAKYHVIVLADGERVRHDANNDGKVTISDAVSTVDYIMGGKE